MKTSDVMTRDVQVIACDTTLRSASELMRKHDVGSLPVHRDDKLVGMVTDRDIVIRAVAEGLSLDSPVSGIMTTGIKYCYDDQPLKDVAANMGELGIRRLPVMSRDKRLVGFVSLSNVASADQAKVTDTLLEGTARPH